MATTKRRTETILFEVVVSFDGLDKGDRFSQPADDLGWALMHVENGYLQVVAAEEAPNAGEVGQG